MQQKSQHEASLYIAPGDRDRYMRQINDIHDERLCLSNEHGIGYTVVSLTVPGIQGITNKAEAEKIATETNNWVAEQIKNHRDRLDLDVPLYIHPAAPADVIYEKLYRERSYLVGPPLSFANGVNLHTLGIITNGIFDRFPTAKVIIGHDGEHIPFDFWRINHWFEDVKKPISQQAGDVMCKKTIYDYCKENIWITTSGHFSTRTLKYVVDEIGADRVLFSVDYPYERIEDGCECWDNDAKAIQEAVGGVDAYRRIERDRIMPSSC
ncbi:2,3-dihydroxybenzoate decarboxylase [Aspergillus cristatus]|uniref:2,3-dihydroxybenzoate decarboxylase n=1 Tax=Aspergillus cristatus TaxID=573508 RepID=A0A1E3BQN5_ASPCR|nr:2,3-dihydroxybenzoate decarboxylase [Aspergillus cristatus]